MPVLSSSLTTEPVFAEFFKSAVAVLQMHFSTDNSPLSPRHFFLVFFFFNKKGFNT